MESGGSLALPPLHFQIPLDSCKAYVCAYSHMHVGLDNLFLFCVSVHVYVQVYAFVRGPHTALGVLPPIYLLFLLFCFFVCSFGWFFVYLLFQAGSYYVGLTGLELGQAGFKCTEIHLPGVLGLKACAGLERWLNS